MATITIPDTSSQPGLVAQGDDVISGVDIPLVTGSKPAVLQTDEKVKLSAVIGAIMPVMYDATNTDEIVPAVAGTPAIGLAMVAITAPGSGALKAIPVWRAGCFNPAKINWPASYDTDEKKKDAFKGAATPTAIVIREVKTATVV